MLELNGNSERLQRSQAELVELQLVLEKAGSFFDDAQHRASTAAFDSRPSPTPGEPVQENQQLPQHEDAYKCLLSLSDLAVAKDVPHVAMPVHVGLKHPHVLQGRRLERLCSGQRQLLSPSRCGWVLWRA